MSNSPIQLASYCLQKLAEHDIQAFIEWGESTDGEVVLRIPDLETEGDLSQSAVYRLISEWLEVGAGEGLRLISPITGELLGIFCFHPDTFIPATDGADVEYWPATASANFCWSKLEKDSTKWCEGWPIRGSEVYGQRISFITALFMAQPVYLPRAKSA